MSGLRRATARIALGCMGMVLAFGAPEAGAQSRRALNFQQQSLSRPGENTSVGRFANFSYGLGSLQSPQATISGGVLSSSIYQSGFSLYDSNPYEMPPQGLPVTGIGGLTVPRGGIGAGSTGLGVGSALSQPLGGPVLELPVAPAARPGAMGAGIGTDYTAGQPLTSGAVALKGAPALPGQAIEDLGGQGVGAVLALQDDTAFGAARAYVRALEEASSSLLRERTEPITSLVPVLDSPYRQYMLKGDRAFRANNYQEAYADFQIANDMGGGDAESYVCLMHAQFALSRYTYAKAAYFLQQALHYMPELPLANLRPRGFYGSMNKFAEHLVSLEEHIERNPADGEALLLLAYFRWFGQAQDVEATRKALLWALSSATQTKDTRLVEAVETFWDGMLASGKASGRLEPAPGPGGQAGARPGAAVLPKPAGEPASAGGRDDRP